MHRRKNYFIKKKFQVNFLYKFILLLVVESALIIFLFSYLSGNTVTTGYLDSVLKVESTRNFFLVPFLLITLIVVLGVSLVGMVEFIFLSHRIAGPLYRFEKALEQLKEGDLVTTVHLRSTDQLRELQNSLNSLIETLAKRIGVIKRALNEIKEHDVNSQVSQKLTEIKNELNRFHVPADTDTRK